MNKLDSYSEETKKQIEYFLENSNHERMSKTIIKLFFAYLRDSKEGLSVDFDDILYDVETLINFLDKTHCSIQATKSDK